MNENQDTDESVGPLISYSINAEDVLLRRVFAGRRTGFFIDVGAEDPVNGNDLFGLYELGWRGINIEPNPYYFAQLVQKRPEDLNLQVFLSDEPAEALPFFIVENTGLSTGDAEQAEIHASHGTEVRQVEMRAVMLKQVLDDAKPPHIDILKIDVEGFEEQVLHGNDWGRYRPSLIMLEANLPQSPVRRQTTITEYLEGVGYCFVHHDGLNDFFVEKDFVLPPDSFRTSNVFDNVMRWDMVVLRDTYDDLQAHSKNVEHYAKALEGERDEMGKALSKADHALEEKQRSEQRLSAALEATSQIAINLLANGPEQVDMTLARSGLLPMPGQAAELAEVGRELVVVNSSQVAPEDDRHLLTIQLQMVQAHLGSLQRQKEHLDELVKDLQFQNRRLSAGNEQLQGERLALHRALDQARSQTGILIEPRRVVSELQSLISDEGAARIENADAAAAQLERVRAEAARIKQENEKAAAHLDRVRAEVVRVEHENEKAAAKLQRAHAETAQIERENEKATRQQPEWIEQERRQRVDDDTFMLQALYASTSWKLTKPVRVLGRLLRLGRS